MSVQSTSDRFVDLMGAIRRLDADNSDPMRHAVRRLKNNANAILDRAINEAWEVVEVARQLPGDCADAITEAKKGQP